MKAMTVKQYEVIRKYSRRQMERFYQGVFQLGIDNGVRQVAAASACWMDTELFDLLRGEHIGEERARRIVEKIMSRYGGDISELGEGEEL
jgi:hypothetical protein